MTPQPDRLTLRRPDDWHLHLRDGAMLRAVLPHSTAHFGRAIIMPNLTPPVVTTADAVAYRERILAALPAGARFTPLMTAYLTEGTDPDDLARGKEEGVLTAVKLYPAGATTNSHAGVRSKLRQVSHALAAWPGRSRWRTPCRQSPRGARHPAGDTRRPAIRSG